MWGRITYIIKIEGCLQGFGTHFKGGTCQVFGFQCLSFIVKVCVKGCLALTEAKTLDALLSSVWCGLVESFASA
jgi:hypothetical protein